MSQRPIQSFVTMSLLRILGIIFAAVISHPSYAGLSDVVGLWQLNGDLANEVMGADPLDASSFLAGAVFAPATIGGQPATVLDIPALTPAEMLTVTNTVGPTGGGAFTNDWTIAMDINLPVAIAPFSSLLQTSPDNSNDVDIFIRGSNNGIDIGGATVGAGTFFADTWYRLVVTAKSNAAAGTITTSAYSDGVFLGSTDNNTFDGTFGLGDVFHLFADESSETARTLANSIGYWGEPLSAVEIAALGPATAAGIDPTIPIPALTVQIDRDTREISLQNNFDSNLFTQGYTLSSGNGTLDSDVWLSVAENADADSGGSLDPVNRWIQLTTAGSRTDLSEGVLGTSTLPGATDYSFGTAWIPHPDEDVVFEYLDENGELVGGLVEYVGNGGEPFPLGDLDFDNDLDGDDWLVYVAGLGFSFPELSIAEAYAMGDLTGDRVNGHDDFRIFKNAYDAANGVGAFNQMIGVPEPSTLLLSFLGFVFISQCRLRHSWRRQYS